ncbi:VCBS repeat-containing protein [bacterium]|nr:VCBS repeat-containing protein [bacterium]
MRNLCVLCDSALLEDYRKDRKGFARIAKRSQNIIVAFSLFISTLAMADDSVKPSHTLSVPGRIQAIIPADLNGDNICDFIVSSTYCIQPGNRIQRILISIMQTAPGEFHVGRAIPVPETAICFDIDRENGQLLLLRTIGLTCHNTDTLNFNAPPLRGIHLSPWLTIPDPSSLPMRHLSIGSQKYVVPTTAGLEILKLQDSGIFRQSLLKTPPRLTMKSNDGEAHILAPDFHTGYFNPDSIIDGFAIINSDMDCYLRAYNAAPDGRPSTWRYHFSTHSLTSSVLESMDPPQTNIQLTDLDGDGLTDLLAIKKPLARFATDLSQIRVYMNRGGYLPEKPDQIITSDHFSGNAIAKDFNGDGLKDLALDNFSTGLTQALRYLLTGRVKIGCSVHYMKQDNSFNAKPDRQFSFSRSTSLTEMITKSQTGYYITDLNKDTYPDLLAVTDDNKWALFPGCSDKLFDKKNLVEMAVPAKCQPVFHDINGDNIKDLLFWQPDESGIIYLYLSEPSTP